MNIHNGNEIRKMDNFDVIDNIGLKMRVLRPKNAAAYLQISKSTLERLVLAGKVKPPIKTGAVALFDVVDLDRYINENVLNVNSSIVYLELHK
jgi:excisionase family DNA binding protein